MGLAFCSARIHERLSSAWSLVHIRRLQMTFATRFAGSIPRLDRQTALLCNRIPRVVRYLRPRLAKSPSLLQITSQTIGNFAGGSD